MALPYQGNQCTCVALELGEQISTTTVMFTSSLQAIENYDEDSDLLKELRLKRAQLRSAEHVR